MCYMLIIKLTMLKETIFFSLIFIILAIGRIFYIYCNCKTTESVSVLSLSIHIIHLAF